MHATGTRPESAGLRALMIVLRRAGLRISEALALNETDLDPERGRARTGRGVSSTPQGSAAVLIGIPPQRWQPVQRRSGERSGRDA